MKLKKLTVLICVLACLLSLTACSQGTEDESLTSKYDSSQIEEVTTQLFDSFRQTSKEDMEYLVDADNSEVAADVDMALAIKTAMSSWLNVSEDLGDYVSTDGFEMSAGDDSIIGTLSVTFANRKAEFEITYAKDMSKYTAIKITPEYTIGEKLGKAVLNTVMGMGIVFIILILIAFCISLFKYINKAEAYFADKKLSKQGQMPFEAKDTSKAPVVYEPDEEVDDLELVAVITAAVAASMNTSVDKLVVRSIKRKKTNRWS